MTSALFDVSTVTNARSICASEIVDRADCAARRERPRRPLPRSDVAAPGVAGERAGAKPAKDEKRPRSERERRERAPAVVDP